LIRKLSTPQIVWPKTLVGAGTSHRVERTRKLPAFGYLRKYQDLYGDILLSVSRCLSGEAVREKSLVGVV
jgi:hypothetical protein